MCPDFSHVKSVTIPQGSVKRIEQNGRVLWRKPEPPPGELLTFTAIGAYDVTMYLENNNGNNPNCEYSRDGITWSAMPTSEAAAITITSQQSIKLRGYNPNGFCRQNAFSRFVCTSSNSYYEASGSLMSLIDRTGAGDTIPVDYCFASLFAQFEEYFQYWLYRADNLIMPSNATAGCYFQLFAGTRLQRAPYLPATQLKDRCYYQMFIGSETLKVRENGAGTKIFTCPDITGLNNPVTDMFMDTKGTFTGTPTTGNTYNWY